MSREILLQQISDYRSRHPGEATVADRFTAFITSNPGCFERSLAIGHLTGSAWIVNRDASLILLTHHRKLNRWLQLGGHADGDPDISAVALREAREESGLESFELLTDGIFDLDIHPIPARGDTPEHLHYDIRYLLRANCGGDYIVSEESHDLRWVAPADLPHLTSEPSMLRMLGKSSRFLSSSESPNPHPKTHSA